MIVSERLIDLLSVLIPSRTYEWRDGLSALQKISSLSLASESDRVISEQCYLPAICRNYKSDRQTESL